MNPIRLVLLAAALSCVPAFAQWQWIDNTGRKVFSDQPPPPDIPAKNILKQPGARTAAPAVTPVEPTASAAAGKAPKAVASAPKLTGTDKALEEKKKQAEAAEAEKKKQQEEKMAEARAENCQRAKQVKATMESGVRVAVADAKGERRFLEEKEKAVEIKRADEVIGRDCK